MNFVDVIGVILTAIAIGISIWQAREAKGSVKLAKTYRDEVVQDRSKMALIELLPTTKRVREEYRK
jgi:hypothetical protein